ncbi:MAG: hypothetical protein M1830_005180 [Pleopsidium flavum]|nr:MAG: hypothetical protein M1830_005180 [Pleopsidium flavum]
MVVGGPQSVERVALINGHLKVTGSRVVWNYVDEYLDIKKSTDLGKFLMQSIYVNLAVEVKWYLGSPTADAQKKLLAFYDVLPTHADFEDVIKSEFFEIMTRSHNERRAPKVPDVSGLDRFKSIRPPLSSRASSGNA